MEIPLESNWWWPGRFTSEWFSGAARPADREPDFTMREHGGQLHRLNEAVSFRYGAVCSG